MGIHVCRLGPRELFGVPVRLMSLRPSKSYTSDGEAEYDHSMQLYIVPVRDVAYDGAKDGNRECAGSNTCLIPSQL